MNNIKIFIPVKYLTSKNELISYQDYETDGDIIRRIDNKHEMSIQINEDGYKTVRLRKNGKSYTCRISRLILTTFKDDSLSSNQTADHEDRSRNNDNINNLNWKSHSDQNKNRNTYQQKNQWTPVCRLNSVGIMKTYKNLEEAAVDMNCNKQSICNWLSGMKSKKRDEHGGHYIWKYPEEKDLEGEIWKQVSEIHHVSQFGRIKVKVNDIYSSKKYAKEYKTSAGYPQISINGSLKGIHLIIAKEFLPNPDNKPNVNHKDRNRNNCDVTNLEWITQRDNIIHANDNGARVGTLVDRDPTMSINVKSGEIIYFKSQFEASEILNLRHDCICDCVNGKRKTHKGYIFKRVSNRDLMTFP
jgi:hypothetical protein